MIISVEKKLFLIMGLFILMLVFFFLSFEFKLIDESIGRLFAAILAVIIISLTVSVSREMPKGQE